MKQKKKSRLAIALAVATVPFQSPLLPKLLLEVAISTPTLQLLFLFGGERFQVKFVEPTIVH